MTIAIAGSGDLTRYLAEEFSAANIPLVILTRREKPHFNNIAGVTQKVVDFTSTSSLLSALNESKATALLSTILTYDTDAFVTIHKNLISAAQQSTSVTRFIPSEYGVNVADYPDQPAFYWDTREPIRQILRQQTSLEWTIVSNGWIIDYIIPSKNRYMKDIGDAFFVNLAKSRMLIPGTGKEAVDVISARELARGLVMLLQAPAGSWEEYIYLSAEQVTGNKIAEMVRMRYPGVEFVVERVSLARLVYAVRDAKSDFERIDAEYKISTCSGASGLEQTKVQEHRGRYFRGLRFRTVSEILDAVERDPEVIV
ncbi:hypothetical protein BJY04DRAFT_213723 [Aspergillus karnatakaensis]|uniref:uncharacterized protein n=1 Tax=Aspergillus karnatakaensis TaxID=1810916 RepID=UPI003CCDBA75